MTAQTILQALTYATGNGWAAVALKATVAMLIAMLFTRAARRASASLRHVVVASTFGVLLFLPLAAKLVPARVVTVPAQRQIEQPVPAIAPPAMKDAAGVGGAPQFDWRNAIYSAYVGGVALLGGSLLLALWRLHRLQRNADVSVAATALANGTARAMGLGGGIQVFLSEDLAVPITFGWTHPVILLPASTKNWTDEEIARAIRHELEHIARGDWATHIVSRIACAFYWPHPFVWVLWRRLRLEAERACDDAVIRTSETAEPYAEQLVSLARELRNRRGVPALAMATRSNLGQRVEAILDRGLRRRPLTRLTSVGVAIAAMTCMLTVAPFQLMSATVERQDEILPSEEEADPLDVALLEAAAGNKLAAMQRLMERGARPNAAISGDGTPLIAAARGGHLDAMEMLINAGADVNRAVTGDGNPLIAAAQHGHIAAVSLLLDRGARVDEGVPGDGNALIMAAGAGHLPVVTFLLDRGASIEKVVPGDENALIHASEGGQAHVVRYLIERGANVNARVWADFWNGDENKGEWRTALRMAKRHKHDEVVAILVAAGAKE